VVTYCTSITSIDFILLATRFPLPISLGVSFTVALWSLTINAFRGGHRCHHACIAPSWNRHKSIRIKTLYFISNTCFYCYSWKVFPYPLMIYFYFHYSSQLFSFPYPLMISLLLLYYSILFTFHLRWPCSNTERFPLIDTIRLTPNLNFSPLI